MVKKSKEFDYCRKPSKEAEVQNDLIKKRDARKHIEEMIKAMNKPEAPSFFDGFFKQ